MPLLFFSQTLAGRGCKCKHFDHADHSDHGGYKTENSPTCFCYFSAKPKLEEGVNVNILTIQTKRLKCELDLSFFFCQIQSKI